MSRPKKLGIGGLILVTLGAGVGMGGLIYRSQNEVIGADIGAGLMMLMGIVLASIGGVILIAAAVDSWHEKPRSRA